jgi:hypothetical protein
MGWVQTKQQKSQQNQTESESDAKVANSALGSQQ